MHDYLTIVRKKMLRPLLYDYQRTTLYYTIYRTFKSLSSDDFTTISRLFYRKNYDYWLRLFQNLLRLFQPKHYDYCSPLLAIGRKPEKRCGKSRQWFRAAGLTLYRWRRWPLSRHSGCSTCQRSADGRSWPRRAGMVCGMLHRCPPYIPYYNRRLRWLVQRPAWRRRYYIRLCRSGIVSGWMGQIAGKTPVKPCALFCVVGGIVALTMQNAL